MQILGEGLYRYPVMAGRGTLLNCWLFQAFMFVSKDVQRSVAYARALQWR